MLRTTTTFDYRTLRHELKHLPSSYPALKKCENTESTMFDTYFLQVPGSYSDSSDYSINDMSSIIWNATKFDKDPVQKFAVVFKVDKFCLHIFVC